MPTIFGDRMTAPARRFDPAAAEMTAGSCPAVRRLILSHFRNYAMLRLTLNDAPVVLTGANGSGKTNLLEALSFLAPGRGLRRARLADVDMLASDETTHWTMSVELDGAVGTTTIGTGRDPEATGRDRRLVRIDGAPAKSQSALADHLAVSWLTPQMDRLFTDGASGRRRFLDRLVHAFDPHHAGRVNRYSHVLRERMRLLRQGHADEAWQRALEDQLTTVGVAIAAARRELVERLAPEAAADCGPFPGALLEIDGEIEAWLDDDPALVVEDRFRAALAAGRSLASGEAGVSPGPHRSDLIVRHSKKSMFALYCSTGEQKALLIAILIAHARLRRAEFGAAPLMLLDEVVAHLDEERRTALGVHLTALRSQVWMTGTDAALFAPFAAGAQFFVVSDGTLTQH